MSGGMVERVAVALSGAPFPSKASLRRARAAIEAMREPIEEMIEAGFRAREPGMTMAQSTSATWSAMIDEALK